MKIEAPCRLGKRFESKSTLNPGRFTLTGMSFFKWNSQNMSNVTLHGKRDPDNSKINTSYFEPGDARTTGEENRIEIPDHLIVPGCPMRELGFDSDGVGWLSTILWAPGYERDKPMFAGRRWCYAIHHGRDYGGPLDYVWSEKLDKLFEPVLPLHAVQLDVIDFFA